MMLHMWMTYNNMRQPWYLVMLCNTRIIDDYLVIIILVFDLTIMWVSSIVTYVSNYHVCTLNFHIDKQCVMLVKILILTKTVIFSYFQFQEITILVQNGSLPKNNFIISHKKMDLGGVPPALWIKTYTTNKFFLLKWQKIIMMVLHIIILVGKGIYLRNHLTPI